MSTGDRLLDDGNGEPKLTANSDRRLAESSQHFQKNRPQDVRDSARRRPRSDSMKTQRAHDVLPASLRRHRKRSSSRDIADDVISKDLREGSKASVTAIHARRLDKQTGLTFIETKYKEENTPAFIFVNHVV